MSKKKNKKRDESLADFQKNKRVLGVVGLPSTGKSRSLENLNGAENFCYLNCDLKSIPFRSNFKYNIDITDIRQLPECIDIIEAQSDISLGIIDTMSKAMSMFEDQIIANSDDVREAWGAYGNFYRSLMHKIKAGSKSYAILMHLAFEEESDEDDDDTVRETYVPVKGAIRKVGVHSDYTNIVETVVVKISKLDKMAKQLKGNKLLTITDEEREDGVKHCFLTRRTRGFEGSMARSQGGLWSRAELLIDNDIQAVMKRIDEYYE